MACGLMVVGVSGVLVAAAGGSDRIGVAASPFAVAAAALAINALTWRRSGPIAAVLYAVGSLAVIYGLLRALSVPLRLLIQGSCAHPAPCPLGYDYPLTAGENVGLYIAVVAGATALFSVLIAVEIHYRRRSRGAAKLR